MILTPSEKSQLPTQHACLKDVFLDVQKDIFKTRVLCGIVFYN